MKSIFLSSVLPIATEWVKRKEDEILKTGMRLSKEQIDWAVALGINKPEQIKILAVPQIPLPEDSFLSEAAIKFKLITSGTAGLTFRYGILIRNDHINNKPLCVHELMHVKQYERLGCIDKFLEQYIEEIFTFGYEGSPLEKEALEKEEMFRIRGEIY